MPYSVYSSVIHLSTVYLRLEWDIWWAEYTTPPNYKWLRYTYLPAPSLFCFRTKHADNWRSIMLNIFLAGWWLSTWCQNIIGCNHLTRLVHTILLVRLNLCLLACSADMGLERCHPFCGVKPAVATILTAEGYVCFQMMVCFLGLMVPGKTTAMPITNIWTAIAKLANWQNRFLPIMSLFRE